MRKNRVIYCPNSSIHTDERVEFKSRNRDTGETEDRKGIPYGKSPNRIIAIIRDNDICVYCPDSKCVKDRKGTWTQITMRVCGKPISFKDVAITIKEMPQNYSFELDKIPMVVEG